MLINKNCILITRFRNQFSNYNFWISTSFIINPNIFDKTIPNNISKIWIRRFWIEWWFWWGSYRCCCLIQKYLNTISEWNEILKHSSVCDMHVCISPKSWKVTCPRFSQTLPRLFNGSCWRGLRLLRNRSRSRPCWQYILGQLVLSVCFLLYWSSFN